MLPCAPTCFSHVGSGPLLGPPTTSGLLDRCAAATPDVEVPSDASTAPVARLLLLLDRIIQHLSSKSLFSLDILHHSTIFNTSVPRLSYDPRILSAEAGYSGGPDPPSDTSLSFCCRARCSEILNDPLQTLVSHKFFPAMCSRLHPCEYSCWNRTAKVRSSQPRFYSVRRNSHLQLDPRLFMQL